MRFLFTISKERFSNLFSQKTHFKSYFFKIGLLKYISLKLLTQKTYSQNCSLKKRFFKIAQNLKKMHFQNYSFKNIHTLLKKLLSRKYIFKIACSKNLCQNYSLIKHFFKTAPSKSTLPSQKYFF